VDSKNGWAVGDCGTILHTQNGGNTWEKQKSPVQYYLMGVHFATPLKGWAVGERTTILNTTDAGKTWQVQFKDEDYILKAISFCDDRTGWAVGEYGLIYHTEDGSRWTKQGGGFGISEETGDIEAGNILFSVVAVSPKIALAVGIDGYITKTSDGGATWITIGKNVPKVHLFGLAQGDQKIIIGGTSLLKSSFDGGTTFNKPEVQPEITYGWIYAIAPRGKAGFTAVGKGGWIYTTDKNALAWRLSEIR
jgi:photosystem II stability/assembly factor-like uncharacterized protein